MSCTPAWRLRRTPRSAERMRGLFAMGVLSGATRWRISSTGAIFLFLFSGQGAFALLYEGWGFGERERERERLGNWTLLGGELFPFLERWLMSGVGLVRTCLLCWR